MSKTDQKKINLDSILKEIGYIGKSQILYLVLICFIIFYSGTHGISYVFVSGDLNYRCYIPECDNSDIEKADYNPQWLRNFVPMVVETGLPVQCLRYRYSSGVDNVTQKYCELNSNRTEVEQNVLEKCDRFVFETNEKTILNDFNLTCSENKWKLTLSGTMHSAGVLLNLLMIGYFSDRFGRKAVFIISPIISVVFAILQTFAWDFWSFIALKFLEPLLSAGTYSSGLILAIELVSPKYRAIVGTIIFASGSFGKAYLGLIAMLVQNWKVLTILNYIPSLVAIVYFWILPESLKWLLVKRRFDEIAVILLRIIKWNNLKVPLEITDVLQNTPALLNDDTTTAEDNNKSTYPIRDVFKSPAMILRILSLSFCWITNVFVFYGLTLISVSIGGNKYTNFIIVNLMEIPACFLVIMISNSVGRKKILCTALTLSGLLLLAYPFVTQWYWIKLIVFMIGKFAITVSFTTIYIYTSEVVPTSLRQTLIGVCSAFGRIGSLSAPQAPLLELVMPNLSIYLFGGTALAAGILSLRFPETLNTMLPDTVEQALQIGRKVDKGKGAVVNKIEMSNFDQK